mgnify:CR=1 FL=1
MKQLIIILGLIGSTSFCCSAQNDSIPEQKLELDKLSKENTVLNAENVALNQKVCKANLSILNSRLRETHLLMQYWINVPSHSGHSNKTRANDLIDNSILIEINELNQFLIDQKVSNKNQESYLKINSKIKDLFSSYDEIRMLLSDFSSYQDPMVTFSVESIFEEECIPLFETIINEIDELTSMIFSNEK